MKDKKSNKNEAPIENQEPFDLDKVVKALLTVKPRKKKAGGNGQPPAQSSKATSKAKS